MFFKAAAVLALVANALAQTASFATMTSPSEGSTIAAGSVFNIEWLTGTVPYSGPVKIELLGGATPSTLEIKGAVGTGINYATGKFAWNVDSSLGSDATYGIKITMESDSTVFQYSFPFKISGKDVATTSSPAPKPSVSVSTTPATIPSKPAVYADSEECDDDEYATVYSVMNGPAGGVSTGTILHTVWLANSAKPAAATPAIAPGYPGAVAAPKLSPHNNGTSLAYQPTSPAAAPVAATTAPAAGTGSVSGSSTGASSPVRVSGASAAAVGRLVMLSGAAMAFFAL